MTISNNKIVWVCDPYSDLPSSQDRYSRYHTLSVFLRGLGCEVHFFISNFSHTHKSFILNAQDTSVFDGIIYHLIKTPPYKNHFSISRILYEKQYAIGLVKIWDCCSSRPDFIIFRDPLIFQAPYLKKIFQECRSYSVDVIDLWPELFSTKLPFYIRYFECLIFYSLYNRRKKYMKGAKVVTCVTSDYFERLNYISYKTPKEVFYWGVDHKKVEKILKHSFNIKSNDSFKKDACEFWITYTGTLGDNYDIDIIIRAAISLKENKFIKFFIAGKGPLQEKVQTAIKVNCLSNLTYLGFINQSLLFSLLSLSNIGLLTYSKGSTVSMPIKFYDYIAVGLPVLNSLRGEVSKFILEHDLGLNYDSGNIDSFLYTINQAYFKRASLFSSKAKIKDFSRRFDSSLQYRSMAKFIYENI